MQLGHADLFNESMPREVKLDILKGRKVVDIGGGLYHTVILTGLSMFFCLFSFQLAPENFASMFAILMVSWPH